MKAIKKLAGAFLMLSSVSSYGAILYENPVDTSMLGGGHNQFTIPGSIGAENFTLAADSFVERIGFTAAHLRSNPMSSSIDWAIRTDGGTTPGAVITSGNSGYSNSVLYTVTFAPTATWDLLLYTIDIPDIQLTAGNYWVTFHPNGYVGDPHWSRAMSGDSLNAISYDGGVTWSSPYPLFSPLAFRVEGSDVSNMVPEPSSMLLFTLGLIGFSVGRYRAKG